MDTRRGFEVSKMSEQSEQSGLTFDEKKHEYKYGDRVLTSVTQWLGQFEEPFDVKAVSKQVAANYKRHNYITPEEKPITPGAVRKYWDWVREEGTRVHRQIEGLIKGEKLFPKPNLRARQAHEYIMKELAKYEDGHIEPELRIHSLRFGLAGMLDCPVFFKGNKLHIYDWKCVENLTAKKLKKYTFQLSTYAYLMEYECNITIDGLTLVQVLDEGSIPYEIEYKKEEVIAKLKESGKW